MPLWQLYRSLIRLKTTQSKSEIFFFQIFLNLWYNYSDWNCVSFFHFNYNSLDSAQHMVFVWGQVYVCGIVDTFLNGRQLFIDFETTESILEPLVHLNNCFSIDICEKNKALISSSGKSFRESHITMPCFFSLHLANAIATLTTNRVFNSRSHFKWFGKVQASSCVYL